MDANESVFRTLKGPFLNYLVREFSKYKQNLNVLDINLMVYLIQKNFMFNYFSFDNLIKNVLPLNPDICDSFNGFGMEDVNFAYPPTEEEEAQINELIDNKMKDYDFLERSAQLLYNLHNNKELEYLEDNEIKDYEDILFPLINYIEDTELVMFELHLPEEFTYPDLIAYRNYVVNNSLNMDKEVISYIVNIFNNCYNINIPVNNKILYYTGVNIKKIIKDTKIIEKIHRDYNVVDFYRFIDPLINLNKDVLKEITNYIDSLTTVITNIKDKYVKREENN